MEHETIDPKEYGRRRRARFRYSKEMSLEAVNIKQQADLWARWQNICWSKLNPRVYKDVDRFHDYRAKAVFFAVNLWAARDGFDEEFGEEQKQALISSNVGDKYDFPMFFVGRDLLEACLNTKPPENIDWRVMKLPFEQITFVFEKNTLSVEDQEILFLQYTRARRGEYVVDLGLEEKRLHLHIEKELFFVNGIAENFANYRRVLSDQYSPNKDWAVFDGDPFDRTLSDEEAVFLEKMTNLVFNLIFVMKARPKLVESGRRVGFHKKQKSEVWTPHLLGVKYRIKRESSSSTRRVSGESLGSRKIHWRAGHTREQKKGKILNLGTCDCSHHIDRHSNVENTSFCLDCESCLIFRQATRVFSEVETKWIEPILVGEKESR